MQLCALDENNALVFAQKAKKQHEYICMECGYSVRVRQGIHRQPHYYHTQPNRECRQHGKGMAHLLLQYALKAWLPEGEAQLECRFESIGRIADVAWPAKQLIYEIQYSPITASEVQARNRDYASLGYQVIWIFSDERYNNRSLTPAENIVSDSPHYFTNMNIHGEGVIYDEFSLTDKGVRILRLPKLIIDPANPEFTNKEIDSSFYDQIPQQIKNRISQWRCYFKGDAIDTSLKQCNDTLPCDEQFFLALKQLIALEREILTISILTKLKEIYRKYVLIPYSSILRLLLERACR